MVEWELQYGEELEYLETLEEINGVPHANLLKRPELGFLERDLYEAYWLLAASRPIGMGAASGIPTADILAFAKAEGWEGPWFLRVIREVDGVFLIHLIETAEESKKSKRPTT